MRWPLGRRAPDCKRVARVLQSFLDGELGAAEADVVATHLAHCERCGIDAQTFRDVKASLEQLRPDIDVAAMARLQSFADELTSQ